jgi:elongation factor P
MQSTEIAIGFEVGGPIVVSQGDKVAIDTPAGEYRKRV